MIWIVDVSVSRVIRVRKSLFFPGDFSEKYFAQIRKKKGLNTAAPLGEKRGQKIPRKLSIMIGIK